jgi:plasmid maintenance system antidote protein VapI
MSACGVSDEEAFEMNTLSLFYSCALALLALDLHVPVTRIADIVGERRGITADTAPIARSN